MNTGIAIRSQRRLFALLIAATLAMYLTVYAALIVAYVGVLKYLAEKPADLPGVPAAEPEPLLISRSWKGAR